jgi:hypothetical protein
LERFFDEGISIDMLREKIVKQALQQGFTSRSRWLLQILGLIIIPSFHYSNIPYGWHKSNITESTIISIRCRKSETLKGTSHEKTIFDLWQP